MRLEHRMIEANGYHFHAVCAGPKEGELVLMLHGFPEFWYGFRHQITELAENGYYVVVPDQRGYNESDKPQAIESYTLDELRDDCEAMIDFFKRERAIVIGHDWGGAVAWHLAATRPNRVKKLIPVNIPHPADMPKGMLKNPTQLVRSLYMVFFQLPYVPEKVLKADAFKYMAKGLEWTGRHGAFDKEELEHYRTAWLQPGAIKAMLNWYRAVRIDFRHGWKALDFKIDVPTTILWGLNDPFLSKTLAKESLKRCTQGELIYIGDATHWVHHEYPSIINHLIVKSLSKNESQSEQVLSD
ncbi:alpha/beta hydrolase [Shouchella sp. 1P09AA]|uniref:alpha/beta fold hydrolase n=1 Tax=unclassified Shouchella TaxID=2893065 RepID=UPI0039A0F8EA